MKATAAGTNSQYAASRRVHGPPAHDQPDRGDGRGDHEATRTGVCELRKCSKRSTFTPAAPVRAAERGLVCCPIAPRVMSRSSALKADQLRGLRRGRSRVATRGRAAAEKSMSAASGRSAVAGGELHGHRAGRSARPLPSRGPASPWPRLRPTRRTRARRERARRRPWSAFDLRGLPPG